MSLTIKAFNFSVFDALIRSGIILALIFAAQLCWFLLKGQQSQRAYLLQTAFCIGTIWEIGFAGEVAYILRASGGIGFESKIYKLITILALETSVAGLLAFRAGWRVLAFIPCIFGAYAALPWLIAIGSKFKT